MFQISVEKWNLYNSSRVHIHRPSCVAQEIQRLNALELEKKIGKSVLGKVGWVCWYCFSNKKHLVFIMYIEVLPCLHLFMQLKITCLYLSVTYPCCIRDIWVQEPMNSILFWPCNIWAPLGRTLLLLVCLSRGITQGRYSGMGVVCLTHIPCT